MVGKKRLVAATLWNTTVWPRSQAVKAYTFRKLRLKWMQWTKILKIDVYRFNILPSIAIRFQNLKKRPSFSTLFETLLFKKYQSLHPGALQSVMKEDEYVQRIKEAMTLDQYEDVRIYLHLPWTKSQWQHSSFTTLTGTVNEFTEVIEVYKSNDDVLGVI